MPCAACAARSPSTRTSPKLLVAATERLLRAIVAENAIDSRDIASALFTLTPDLVSEFPAVAARRIGWTRVPLLELHRDRRARTACALHSRVVHVNTDKAQDEIVHVYLDGARMLRPDLIARERTPRRRGRRLDRRLDRAATRTRRVRA